MWLPTLPPSELPLYVQLANKMADDIISGTLKVGEKLPPQRQLSWHLNINLSTVTKAFQLASKRHLIFGEVGRGTYVLAQSSEAKLYKLKENNNRIDLSTHIPVNFENDEDLKCTLQMLLKANQTGTNFNTYLSQHTIKRIQLRAKDWLAQFNYEIASEHCIATSTAQNALLVTLLASCNENDTILVNEFTFPGMKTVAKQLKLKLYGIKMDNEGLKPDALELAIRTTGASVLVSDPNQQNPTASNMGAQRSTEIIRIIKKYKLLLIEEYVVGALSNNPPLSRNMQEHSVLITSFAKAVNPGVRFAIIAGRHPIISSIKIESHATTWQLCPLIAEVACHWIESGIAKKRLKRQRSELLTRFKLFKKIFPSVVYIGNQTPSAHVWLATNINSEHAQLTLQHLGVEVVPSKYFAVNHQFPHFIRVSLSAAKSIQQLKIALDIIKTANVIMKSELK